MFLTILGKYGPYPKEGGATSGYFLKTNQTKVVFEMGAGCFNRLFALCKPEEIDCIILSHLHFDHVSDMGVFNYYLESLDRKGLLKNKIKVYMPDVICPVKNYICSMTYFDVNFINDGEDRNIGDISFEFFKSKHPVYSLGFVAFYGDKKLVYSSDSDVCENLTNRLDGADLALLDGAFLSHQYLEGNPHMSALLCAQLAKKYKVKTVVTHLIADTLENDYILELNEYCLLAEEMKTYGV